ncbi:MAG: DUF427 domain-containing protein [Actinomycetota bacterium]
MKPSPVEPGPGQESVWDYPRPPRLEPVTNRIVVVLGGVKVADTGQAFRVLETSHPPAYYLPPGDFAPGSLVPSRRKGSYCEFKGWADYFTIVGGQRVEENAGWGYPSPSPGFEAMAHHVALYAGRMDVCFVDGERVTPQPGGFYGGWITARIVGPFKGGPGTMGW